LIATLSFRPFFHQAHFLASRSRVQAAVSGARGGKTTAGVAKVVHYAITQPGYRQADIDAGKPYTVIVAAKIYSKHILDTILPAFMHYIPRELFVGKGFNASRQSFSIYGMRGITRFLFHHGEATSWQGGDPYIVWIDEFPLVKEELFNEAMVRVSNTQGMILLTGTPRGPNWAFSRIYEPWIARGDTQELSFHSWRTIDNPFGPTRAEIDRQRRELPPRDFRRNFEASWEVFSGQIYEEFSRRVHVKPVEKYTFITPSGKKLGTGTTAVQLDYIGAGVDWGFATGHAGVILIAGRSKGRWYVLDSSVDEGVLMVSPSPTGDSWVRRMRLLNEKYGPLKIWADPSEPEHFRTFYENGKLIATPGHNEVRPGIQTVAKYLHVDDLTQEPSLYIVSDGRGLNEKLIKELSFYHYKEGQREEPAKEMDNTCDALRYLLHSVEATGSWSPEPGYTPGMAARPAYAR